MTIHKAPSKLSSQDYITCFSGGLLIIFLLIISAGVYYNHSIFLKSRLELSQTALLNSRDAILSIIRNNKKVLDHYVANHRSQVINLIKYEDPEEQLQQIKQELQYILPHLITANIINPDGDIIIPDYDALIGSLCISDLMHSISSDHHIKQTHPNVFKYHYDEISHLVYNNKKYLFFANFSLEQISEGLQYMTPRGHNLQLINTKKNNLIEVTRHGGRDKLLQRDNFNLSKDETNSIISSLNIPGTHWTIVDLEDSHIRNNHLLSLLIPAIAIFLIISFIVMAMKKILSTNYNMLRATTNELTEKNTEITHLNTRLLDLSITDELTSLFNRRYFDTQLEHEWNRAIRNKSEISVMFIDIDYFKKYNDHYGHLQGDDCLKQISKLLKNSLSRSNEFIARYGGEEFVAVINSNSDYCKTIADILHEKLKITACPHEKSPFKHVTFSIGIATLVPEKDQLPSTLVKMADTALYQAKDQQRNTTVIYNPN